MRLLMLGGTEFVGRAVVDAGLARGWDVTVFNRGTRAPVPGVRTLTGDRTRPGGLGALADGEWDLVVDTWSSAPRAVRDTARALADRVDRYVYVSSCSVYAWPPRGPGPDESAPLVGGSPDAEEAPYAEAKRGGELAVLDAFGADRSVLARAGLIIGPRENVGRLPWWLARMVRGGKVLAPGPEDAPVQYVDARDLAGWCLTAGADGLSGPYNLAGAPGATTIGEVLRLCAEVTGSDAERVWIPAERIMAAGVSPWTDLPLWVPPVEARDLYHAVYTLDTGRALAAGLRCRPVRETVADTWAWQLTVGGADAECVRGRAERSAVGLDPAVEAELLAGA
jgi:2'-hydroxyisoflavone reductase